MEIPTPPAEHVLNAYKYLAPSDANPAVSVRPYFTNRQIEALTGSPQWGLNLKPGLWGR